MEKVLKVIVFHVDVPNDKNFKNKYIKSQKFSIKFGAKKSTWNLSCNLNGKPNLSYY